ncbi:MAG TPA: class I SAM-dependent methyltransferase [Paracoccaceae bacterium]|nr:class I SAM-dependent methyltransferase [Paracoccaceae bacterium]
MSLKETKLDFEALLSEVIYGHGFLHYGYWPDGRPETPSADLLGRAQQAYFDLLASKIPEGVRTILDVGSGTGSNARALTRLGYALECLCPSEQLNEMARRKLPPEVTVHTTMFEDFQTDRRFDICLFAESFHYIALAPALAQAARYATRGVVIFDYFRRGADAKAPEGTRGTHAEFLAEVARQGAFRLAEDTDLTAAILPTFYVLDQIKNRHIAPFVTRARADFRQSNPWKARALELVLGKAMNRFQKPSRREETFARDFEYRLIVLDRI